MRSDGSAARLLDVTKVYRTRSSEVRALTGVTADLPTGVLTAVAGPSGSGKSTLLRLVAGLDLPTEGVVRVGSTVIGPRGHSGLRRLRRETVGFVFQRPSDNFLPYRSVADQLGDGGGRADRDELLEALGITHRIRHLPGSLSGGEQQRAAFARVILRGAEVVLADEPTAELDGTSARGVIVAMADLASRGITFVVATHDPAIRREAEVVLELEDGRLRDDRRVRSGASRANREDDGWGREVGGTGAEVLVRAEAVARAYRRGEELVHALRGVDLELREGEMVGLVGRSGSGKTTLLHVIGGWERPYAGHVRLLTEGSGWRDLSVVPQRFGLMDELTVRENVEWPARLEGLLEPARPRVDGLLESLGLAELQSRYPRETSVGEQQRTALARALVVAPRVLLADEPTGHQDHGWTYAVLGVLRGAVEEGTACLVATHNERLAGAFDRVIEMSDGRAAERGPAVGREPRSDDARERWGPPQARRSGGSGGSGGASGWGAS